MLEIVTRGIQIVTRYLVFGPIENPVQEPCLVLFLWNSDPDYTARIRLGSSNDGIVNEATLEYDWAPINFQVCGHRNQYSGDCECEDTLRIPPLGQTVIMFKPNEAYWSIIVVPEELATDSGGVEPPMPNGVHINLVSFSKGDPSKIGL